MTIRTTAIDPAEISSLGLCAVLVESGAKPLAVSWDGEELALWYFVPKGSVEKVPLELCVLPNKATASVSVHNYAKVEYIGEAPMNVGGEAVSWHVWYGKRH